MNKNYIYVLIFLVPLNVLAYRFKEARAPSLPHIAGGTIKTTLPAESGASRELSESIKATTSETRVKGAVVQAAHEELVSAENVVCAEGEDCGNAGMQSAVKSGAITEEDIQYKNYATYIPLYQRIDGGQWKQIGFIANKVIPVEKMGNKGTLEVTVLNDGKATIKRGGHDVTLDFAKK